MALPPEVVGLARERIALDLEDRREAFGRQLREVSERFSARGAYPSSMNQVAQFEVMAVEYRVRASIAWQAFARAFGSLLVRLDAEAGAEVKRLIGDLVREHSGDFEEKHAEIQQIMPRSGAEHPTLESFRAVAVARVSSEIDFAVAQATATPEAAASPAAPVTIYQSYGIVQTGPGSTANMSIRVGTEERHAVETAMVAVEQVFEDAEDNGEKRAAVELVQDVRRELDREEPNPHHIRGALQGIGTTIQTMGSAGGAYQLLKGAAALFGLALP